MARKEVVRDNIDYSNQKIVDVEISKEIRSAFLDYSMSVIVSRALPDVRDGLKPVHRRILYAMYNTGLYPDKPYRKCATTVGEVLGHYHPHGDASVYDALVRMAQDFSLRHPLVDGHGNFGSVDGDPAAAYRYTEARMSKISLKMLEDIKKDTVNWVPNFDDTEVEPEVLPTKFPCLLINGSSGIAVGMATNIPPHNMGEVAEGVCCLIDNPDAELEEIMQYIKGPDFPTHGIIMGAKGIKEAYSTGRGKIIVRARAEIKETKNDRFKIIVTELPYSVNKRRLIEKIAELIKDKRIEGIADLQDYTDRHGMHIEITIKRDANAQVVLNNLYKMTEMQTTFGVILLALDGGVPKILTLKQILQKYISFQEEIITRRTRFYLKKAEERAHILEGLAKALDIVDEVIATIRACRGGQSEAKQAIMDKFGFDDPQAAAIVAYRLGQLAGLEIEKILNELEELHEKIKDYNDILNNEQRVLDIVKTEIREVADKYGDERRTEISAFTGDVDDEDLIPVEDCILTLTERGYIKRQTVDTYKAQNRGGKGIMGMSRREEDVAKNMFTCSTHDAILIFTNMGKVFKLKGYQIPEASRTSKGMNVINLLPIEQDEKVTAMVKVPKDSDREYLCMVTRNGVIKRTALDQYNNIRKTGIIAINLDEGDELCWVEITDGERNLIVATHDGMSICFKEEDARLIGRTARGVRAIQLAEGDYVVGFAVAVENMQLLTVSETGYGRRSDFEDYRVQGRAGKGLINYHTDKYGKVAMIAPVMEENDVIMITSDGVVIRTHADQISLIKRGGKGVKVMTVKDNEKVATIGIVERANDEEEITAPEQTDAEAQNEDVPVEE
ncbi:DNA gyrase subunit A [Eubacterium coprostanoligenes]|uniref:DNA gyrase subunit A n=1 Tax=Eubacterium coprostanoligenes TaxID=290054 RepID=UPI0023571D8B|nr:DNA gyrase subunit A [Eubacterium coprostanoligenes]MCI6253970.1 DNA gyrase subunit A [Eubacterium coprostanoligenes]MDY5399907.1 DNA gyrase subunit A [Eubacterium coprostanoligenes]